MHCIAGNKKRSATWRRLRTVAIMAAAAAALSACKSSVSLDDTAPALTTASVSEPASIKDTARAGQRWRKNPKDIRAGLDYARRLEALDQKGQQLEVLKQLVSYHPKNMGLRAYYGRALLKAGRQVQAEGVFRAMIAAGQRDWKTYNALGSALAGQGRFGVARQQYALALKASPGNIKVVNNIAMSHILEGNPQQAETLLRQAMETKAGAGEARIRQNLALAVGLQGRFKEARYIASQDLPPAQVAANMAYLQKMLGGVDTWKRLKQG